MLTVYLDFKSPASCLALEPLIQLQQDSGIAIDWRPFAARAFSVPPRKPDESVGDRHRRVRAEAQRQTHLLYAGLAGREMHFADPPAGSDLALAALAGLQGDPLPLLRAGFEAYWAEGADLDDPATIAALLERAGCTADIAAGKARLSQLRDTALEAGVFDCPSLLIGGELFIGREHLPWVRELITRHAETAPGPL